MRLPALLVAVALAAAPSSFAEDSVAWSSTVDGLRLGAAFGAGPSKPTIGIVFQNVGSVAEDVLLGTETGRGPIYEMKFIATAPDGKQREGLHISMFSAIAGLLLPFSVQLKPGEVHQLEFPLTDIIYISPATVRLDALIKQGYSVRVQFEASQTAANWARLPYPWIGTVGSGNLTGPIGVR